MPSKLDLFFIALIMKAKTSVLIWNKLIFLSEFGYVAWVLNFLNCVTGSELISTGYVMLGGFSETLCFILFNITLLVNCFVREAVIFLVMDFFPFCYQIRCAITDPQLWCGQILISSSGTNSATVLFIY